MHVTKLRIGADANGLVPAGEYFKRLAGALREANAREDGDYKSSSMRSGSSSPSFTRTRKVTASLPSTMRWS
jgi:hypothetical protein